MKHQIALVDPEKGEGKKEKRTIVTTPVNNNTTTILYGVGAQMIFKSFHERLKLAELESCDEGLKSA